MPLPVKYSLELWLIETFSRLREAPARQPKATSRLAAVDLAPLSGLAVGHSIFDRMEQVIRMRCSCSR
jgi:hypothetical protein